MSEEVVEEGAWGQKAEGRYLLLIRTLWLGREISRSVVMAVTCLRTSKNGAIFDKQEVVFG